jgi:competence protein ComK
MYKIVSEQLNDYEVNQETMAILPFYDQFGNLFSYVLEESRCIQVKEKPLKVVLHSCNFYGSSYKGRVEGTAKIMGYTKVAPIIISESLDIFLFPLESPKNEACVWISHAYLQKVIKDETNNEITNLEFTNSIIVPVRYSVGYIEARRNRTAQYRIMIGERASYYGKVRDEKRKKKQTELFLNVGDSGMYERATL